MAITCRNCGARISDWQRFWCSDACRIEFHKRGMQPRPSPRPAEALASKLCWGCDRPLTGKQRRWCSDRCRKRTNRTQQAANRIGEMSANVRESGDKPGRTITFRLEIIATATQVEPFLGYYHPGNHLTQAELRQIYAKLLEKVMNAEAYGWIIRVEVRG